MNRLSRPSGSDQCKDEGDALATVFVEVITSKL